MGEGLKRARSTAHASQKRLVRPLEIKHGHVVSDLLNSQNLTDQERKAKAAEKIASLADIWPNDELCGAAAPETPNNTNSRTRQRSQK